MRIGILGGDKNKDYDLLEVQGNLKIEGNLEVESETDIMVDLNGYTLELSGSVIAKEGSNIGFMNGIITATEGNKNSFISATSSQIHLDNVIVEGFTTGVVLADKGMDEDSYIYINQSIINTVNQTVLVRGNGNNSARKTQLVIDSSTLTSTNYISDMPLNF